MMVEGEVKRRVILNIKIWVSNLWFCGVIKFKLLSTHIFWNLF